MTRSQAWSMSLTYKSQRRRSDTHGLGLDVRAQLRSQRFVGDKIDGPAEQILDVELDPEEAIRIGGAVEADEDVDVAVGARLAAHG